MSIIGIHAGHAKQGFGASGAVGIVKESVQNRKLVKLAKAYIKSRKYNVVGCSAMRGNQQEILNKIKVKSIKGKTTHNVSVHLNSGGGDGVELLVPISFNADQIRKCEMVLQGFCIATGYRNRGVKVKNDLFILNNLAKCVLLECGFVDSKEDCKRLKKNRKKIGIQIGKMCIELCNIL